MVGITWSTLLAAWCCCRRYWAAIPPSASRTCCSVFTVACSPSYKAHQTGWVAYNLYTKLPCRATFHPKCSLSNPKYTKCAVVPTEKKTFSNQERLQSCLSTTRPKIVIMFHLAQLLIVSSGLLYSTTQTVVVTHWSGSGMYVWQLTALVFSAGDSSDGLCTREAASLFSWGSEGVATSGLGALGVLGNSRYLAITMQRNVKRHDLRFRKQHRAGKWFVNAPPWLQWIAMRQPNGRPQSIYWHTVRRRPWYPDVYSLYLFSCLFSHSGCKLTCEEGFDSVYKKLTFADDSAASVVILMASKIFHRGFIYKITTK